MKITLKESASELRPDTTAKSAHVVFAFDGQMEAAVVNNAAATCG